MKQIKPVPFRPWVAWEESKDDQFGVRVTEPHPLGFASYWVDAEKFFTDILRPGRQIIIVTLS